MGSVLISERLGIPSTKYGPSSVGVCLQFLLMMELVSMSLPSVDGEPSVEVGSSGGSGGDENAAVELMELELFRFVSVIPLVTSNLPENINKKSKTIQIQ